MNAITTIPEIGLTEIEGEPRARDIEIAERLGFASPAMIRKLIVRHIDALAGFGVVSTMEKTSGRKGGRPAREYWLNEGQALYLASKSDAPVAPAVLTMLINVFIAYRRGHLTEAPVALLDDKTKSAIGGIVKSCTAAVLREQLGALLPAMLDSAVAAKIAEHQYALRRGRTAGEIWHANGFPRIKINAWFSNRLMKMGCQIEHNGHGELGNRKARLFDPDRAAAWLDNGGRELVRDYVAQRQGQKVLRLVAKH